MGKNDKRPLAKENVPQSGKMPRIEPNPLPAVPLRRPVWRVRRMDITGPWCFLARNSIDSIAMLQKRLSELETMSWQEIDKTHSHFVGVDGCSKEAQDRLKELRLDDLDQLYSLRVTGKFRVFGIREEHVFDLLWCDPDHEVYPSHKKHT